MNKALSNLVVLSLFDGISCGQQGLNRAGIRISKYLASEINEDAIGITQAHYPLTQQLGDVRHIDGYRLRGIVNLLIGGSPCQNFSMAGTRKGMTTKCDIVVDSLEKYLQLKSEGFEFEGESYLFWEFVRLVKEIQPEYFLLENVMMSKKWARIITEALGVDYQYINSSVASAQNRERLYWTNIPYTEIKDKGILLQDVILGGVAGAGTHGKPIPEHLKVPGGFNWKNKGWEFSPHNKGYCVTKSGGSYKNIQGDVKRLTAEDCEKLQTIEVGYTGVTGLCKSRRIETIGNAWTVDVIVEAFFKNLPWASKLKVDPSVKFLNV
jgi:hypothetical protein